MFIHFYATAAELSGGNQEFMGFKVLNIYYLAFYRQIWQTLGLDD